LEDRVHAPVQPLELPRVLADQVRRELAESRAHALGVGRQIRGTERADLAVADDAGVRLAAHERRVADGDRLAARPGVATLLLGKVGAIGGYPGDPHRRETLTALGLGWTALEPPSRAARGPRRPDGRLRGPLVRGRAPPRARGSPGAADVL